ncbi:zinc finger BED domain-containing protein 3 [Sorex araneus]|uniref:zinc finger BED domain-containing protein 3 n=1 Tax=Sorex araneus TaxID=42254 RepID=UPI00243348A3|nr:zinc finger BED domain-containing protein 3 [Sorex araneus]
MKSDEQAVAMEESRGQEEAAGPAAQEAGNLAPKDAAPQAPGQGGPAPGPAPMPPGQLGAPYSEVWGYFHLAPARPGLEEGPWATCRLCGEQVSRGWSFHASTPELWKHLKSVHRRELEKSGSRLSQPSPPGPPCPPLPAPPPPPPPPGPGPAAAAAAAAEGEWARLLEQMRALALRGSQRERELARREAAVEQAERALELRRRALQAEECAADLARRELLAEERVAEMVRRELQADRELLQARLREVSRRECALALAADPRQAAFKEEPESEGDGYLITKVSL